uniref:Uncharacterized protein n=1 Tax=Glossina austeni TaxID=7395 RepID=A0A1A9UVI5_GLOAU
MKTILKQRNKETSAGMGRQSDMNVLTLESVYGRLEKCKSELKTIKTFHNATIIIEQEKMQRNKQDLFELKKRYKAMVLEEIEMKKKRWCPCGKEALERHLRYCSQKCKDQIKDNNSYKCIQTDDYHLTNGERKAKREQTKKKHNTFVYEQRNKISGKVCVINGTGDDISVLRGVTTVGLANIPYMIPNISKSFSGSALIGNFC